MNGMTPQIKVIVRFISPVIMLFGAYITLQGEVGLGGGFAGGVIFASSLMLLTLGYGREAVEDKINMSSALSLASFGALLFLFTMLISFFGGPLLLMLENIGIGIFVAASLYIIFASLASFRIKKEKQ
jgi:multicomponent Na+:H+ antiporter subunit B